MNEVMRLIDPDGHPTGSRAAAPDERAAGRLPRAGARPPAQRPGHRADPAGPARRLPVAHGQEACEVAARPRARTAGLALPHLPRHRGRRRPRRRPRRGADPAARRLAQRLRPARAPRRPAVHPARHPAAARRRASRTPPGSRATTWSRWPWSATARTSEGDFHEALNFAAVWQAPVVFLVQNNGFAISVPLAKQTAAPSLAHKARRLRDAGRLVDGNDAAAVHEVLRRRRAAARARAAARPWSRRSPTASRRTPTPTTPPATAATPRSSAGARRDPIALLRARADRRAGCSTTAGRRRSPRRRRGDGRATCASG